ncbi:glycosyltransferase family 2 protein [Olivibacter domesticus]|uniref:N-terminal domain of galactosyltransferase n=1 Tax=Olivibacter domesticus TaxID=407022 RepID=A0A1H7YFT5_OLID1|nr:glycosyltransferase family 2 protein [Olivibacter domesticus]SEM44980.1 N-terminal domain of galactosyltransferase [Olivibacter domesticus]
MSTNKLPTSTLIIATYNWPKALEKCIQSAFKQTVLPNEIIIADDGSGEETRQLINTLTLPSPIPIHHIWHTDNGFRLSEIRNKAIAAAQFDYIIQVDGDIIMEEHFIEDHLKMAKPKAFICGSRVKLEELPSKKILAQNSLSISKKEMSFGYVLNSFRSPLLGHLLADRYKRNQPTVLRGCNMSFWKKDLISINGYNNDITGWGSEDAELAVRLINSGVKKRFLKFMGIVFHIYHKESDRTNQPKNKQILKGAIENKTTWVKNGIKKEHDHEGRSF